MDTPVVLFGAFDRHNLGDLLFPHVAQAMLRERPGGPPPLRFAGLAARDLRPFGGHRVEAVGALMAGADPVDLIHVGGEILGCRAFDAAVMLLQAAEAQATVAHLASRPAERANWVRRMLGRPSPAPYVLSRRDWPALRRVLHAGVGGVELERLDAAMRDAVLERLRDAEAVTVRDHRTRAALARHGVEATLMPDPAVLVAECFGAAIARHGAAGEPAALRAAFPHGYLAVQCSAVFGDDASLAALAEALERARANCGLGIVLLRAGAAPWHDDLQVLQRLAARMRPGGVRVAASLQLWDLCALLAGSAAVVASSLHARIVATAHGLPRVSLQPARAADRTPKLDAWVDTWEADGPCSVATPESLAGTLQAALAAPAAPRAQAARALAARGRAAYAALLASLA